MQHRWPFHNAALIFCALSYSILFLFSIQSQAQPDGFAHMPGAIASKPEEARSSLRGYVIGASGQPVTDARIELRNFAGRTILTTTVGNAGWFHFTNLEPGWYEVVASTGIAQSVATVNASSFSEPLTMRIGAMPSETHSAPAVSVNTLTVPSKARKAFEVADRLFQKNDMAGAWKHVDKALQSWPKYAQALTLRGLLKMHDNQPQQAVEDFSAALNADQNYHLAYAALAADYNLMGRFDEALRVVDRAASLGLRSWQAHFEASKALLGKQSFDRALQEANQAGSLLKDAFPMLNVVKANAYMGLKDTSSAANELREYLRREDSGPLADRVRALLAHLGK